VAQLLVVDPSQRLSAREALAHPWIQASILSKAAIDYICNLGIQTGISAVMNRLSPYKALV